MAYTPINWQTGDTITAEKMNKMDNGWGVTTTMQTVFNDSVTTVAGEYGNEAELFLSFSADTISVTFNGTEYELASFDVDNTAKGYGGVDSSWNYDFTTYPLAIVVSRTGTTYIATETAGTYTVKIEAIIESVETTTEFGKAVSNTFDIPLPFLCVAEQTTYQEMADARGQNRLLYFYSGSTMHIVTSFIMDASATAVNAVPEGTVNVETYGFQDDGQGNLIFYVAVY